MLDIGVGAGRTALEIQRRGQAVTGLDLSPGAIEIARKRARVFLAMHDTARDILAATSEQLLMSIDQSGDPARSAPWLETTAAILDDLVKQHAGLPVPEAAGQGIAIKR